MKVIISATVVFSGVPLSAAATPATGGPAAETAASAPRHYTVGVSLPSYHYDLSAVSSYSQAVGADLDLVQTFVGWEYSGQPTWSNFPTARSRDFAARGTPLEITWGPSNRSLGPDQPRFSLASIARGDHDAYVTSFARAAKASNAPVRLRFAHEMNGWWEAWSETNSGNKRGDFIKAWRHVHEVFRRIGADNVTWVWSPNIVGPSTTPLVGLYPGDAYVDEVGIDAYSYPTSGCPSPQKLIGPTLAQVSSFSKRPVRLAEVAVSTACEGRGAWITSFFTYLQSTPRITGFTWWERSDSEKDWRVVPRAADRSAFCRGLDTLEGTDGS